MKMCKNIMQSLQTGKPKGTFKIRDIHPTNPNYIFIAWRSDRRYHEYWRPINNNRISEIEERYKNRILQTNIQTDKPIGTFKRKDPHPTIPNLFFQSWNHKKNQERWATQKTLDHEDQRKVNWVQQIGKKKKKEKYANDPNYREHIKEVSRKNKAKPKNRARANKTEKKRRLRLGKKHLQSIQKRAMAKNPEHYREMARINSLKYNYRREVNNRILTKNQKQKMRVIYTQTRRISKCLQIPFDVDHIIPLSKGGLHEPNNLQPVPASWNRSKQNRHCEPWSAWRKAA